MADYEDDYDRQLHVAARALAAGWGTMFLASLGAFAFWIWWPLP